MSRIDGVTPSVARLMQAADGTRTRKEVAELLGYSMNGLAATIQQARRQGRQPRFRDARFGPGAGRIKGRCGKGTAAVKVGSVRLPTDVAAWLRAQIPEGATAAEFVRAMIIDAYHDETGL